jgi:membrane protein
MNKSPTFLGFVKELYRIWVAERPGQLAAALAYYGVFAFAPVIFIAFAVAGVFIDNLAMSHKVFEQIGNVLGPEAAQLLQDNVETISQTTSGGSPLISLPPPAKGETLVLIRQRLFSFVMAIGVGLLLVLATLVNVLLAWFGSFMPIEPSVPISNLIAFVGLVTLSFALIYKVLPDVDIACDVWIGAAVTALLVTLGGLLVGLFVGNGRIGSALEAAGTFAVILIGIYYAAQIFMFGAVLTRVYASMFGSKAVSAERQETSLP